MRYNYSKLKGRIVEIFETRTAFARAMEWSDRTLSLKLNGKTAWTQSDIRSACLLLEIPSRLIPDYFFADEVQSF